MQINGAVLEIQRLEHSAIARVCTEIVVNSVGLNMHRFRNFFRDCLQNV